VLHNVLVRTLSVNAGRSKLGHWLRRAIAGDDIGIVVDGVVVALRPVGVISEDYALREYGVTQDEANAAAAQVSKDIAAARSRGQVKRFNSQKR
jgi:antitoxin (DNA-binding transcriptional repressor) of toxin-antitoxin stability system